MAISGGSGHVAGTSAQPLTADLRAPTISLTLGSGIWTPASPPPRRAPIVRFVIRNDGEFLHEFNIGTAAMHRAHQEAMLEMVEAGVMTTTSVDMQNMNEDSGGGHMMAEMTHDDPNAALIEPGKTQEVIWRFAVADGIQFACNVPGHYESGMLGSIKIMRTYDASS